MACLPEGNHFASTPAPSCSHWGVCWCTTTGLLMISHLVFICNYFMSSFGHKFLIIIHLSVIGGGFYGRVDVVFSMIGWANQGPSFRNLWFSLFLFTATLYITPSRCFMIITSTPFIDLFSGQRKRFMNWEEAVFLSKTPLFSCVRQTSKFMNGTKSLCWILSYYIILPSIISSIHLKLGKANSVHTVQNNYNYSLGLNTWYFILVKALNKKNMACLGGSPSTKE